MMFFMVALLGVMVSWISLMSLGAQEKIRRNDVQGAETDLRLDAAARATENFYRAGIDVIDAGAFTNAQAEALLINSGIPAEWHIRIIAGAPQVSDVLRYRNFYLWRPPDDHVDATGYDPATDTFTPDPDANWRVVYGLPIQQQALDETLRRMTRIARKLNTMFEALVELDPTHNPTVNHYQTRLINGGYLSLAAMRADRELGLSTEEQLDAWGGNILASNTVDANTAAPPYTMKLRAVTPWGSIINQTVVQP